MSGRAVAVLSLSVLAACSRDPELFVAANARAHVGMLAESIGSRPIGTPANARARNYILDQLRQFGFEGRVQEIDARRPELGRTARVANIIAVLPGARPEAVGLLTHYDSSPYSPGAADAALGVAVSLEAARVFAARADRPWTLFVLMTDGEEADLMGAAGLLTDRAVMDRLQAYINLDAIGSGGTALLFETGPANAWIVPPWARRAPHPRGGSWAVEVYRRLPNDTDFSILKSRGIPGLNFATVNDSYAYHTARDTADRIPLHAIRTTGENVVSVLSALQGVDITQRSDAETIYFDVAGTTAVTYGAGAQSVLAMLALLLGGIAWVRLSTDAIRENGTARWLLMLVWTWSGAALAMGGMILATWLLRSAREVYHPWYARPGRLFLLLLIVGVSIGWSVARIGQWLPRRPHPARHPSLTWSVTLPAWIAVAGFMSWAAPAASHLWVLPLLTAGALLAWAPPRHDAVIRVASLLVLVVAATLWLRDTHDLLRFAVAALGRMPVITPVWVYAAAIAGAGLMMVPPLVGSLAPGRPGRRPWLVTSILLLATSAAGGAAYMAPAYTAEQPLRRYVRALQERDKAAALWEIASVEPGIDLGPDAPGAWMPASDTPPATVPWGRLNFPFVFRTEGPALGAAPIEVADFSLKALPDGIEAHLSVVPREPGLIVTIVLPGGVTPARSSLPGLVRGGRWTAAFVAPPPEGIAWTGRFRRVTADQLRQTQITVTARGVPGGIGWQRLPAWLPGERAVWAATATWVVPATAGPDIVPVPPLR